MFTPDDQVRALAKDEIHDLHLRQENYDISRNDLIERLRTMADDVEGGAIDSLSVAVVSSPEKGTIRLEHMWAGTNPYRADPTSGRYEMHEISGFNEEDFVVQYTDFLNNIEMLADSQPDGGFTVGFGDLPQIVECRTTYYAEGNKDE